VPRAAIDHVTARAIIRDVSSDDSSPPAAHATAVELACVKRPYERPRIVWQEAYEPMSFGVSCAKQPGNPGCGSGPYSG
jgi:hypothetical protein